MKFFGNRIIRSQFLRLLPYQVLLLVINSINGIADSIVAANLIGQDAMSAIGLYGPVNHLLYAVSVTLVSGSQILYGRYLAKNDPESQSRLFSLNLVFSLVISAVIGLVMVLAVELGLTVSLASGEAELEALNRYFLGMVPGIPGLVLGQQLFSFLSLENRTRRTMAATLVCVAVNVGTDLLFVAGFGMGVTGLALATVASFWAFFAVMAAYYLSGKSPLRFRLRGLQWRSIGEIFLLGYPGAISRFMEVFRCLIVNTLIIGVCGAAGLSSFAASNSVMAIFWTLPFGMTAVSRMLLSISIGEEDRQISRDIMRVGIRVGGVLVCCMSAALVLAAEPLTRLFFRDPATPEFRMTVSAFRLLPLCMPFSVFQQHFACYYQIMRKKVFATVIPIVNGAVHVVVFSLLLMPTMKMEGLYLSNIINGALCVLLIVLFSIIEIRRFPRNMDDLMAMPENFGIPERDTLNLAIRSMKDVTDLSRRVQAFCAGKGIDRRRAAMAGLALEEMAGNIVKHGFGAATAEAGAALRPGGEAGDPEASGSRLAEIRVSVKAGEVILRLRDNCTPFDPKERFLETEGCAAGGPEDHPDRKEIRAVLDSATDVQMNIGLRLVFGVTRSVRYDNVLGLNVLMIKI